MGCCPAGTHSPRLCATAGRWLVRVTQCFELRLCPPFTPQGQGRVPDPAHTLCSKRCPDEFGVGEAEPRWRKTTARGVQWVDLHQLCPCLPALGPNFRSLFPQPANTHFTWTRNAWGTEPDPSLHRKGRWL